MIMCIIILDNVSEYDELALWEWVKKQELNVEQSQNAIIHFISMNKKQKEDIGCHSNVMFAKSSDY